VSTNRLEAFSDGVFAIAITLLVLEIDVPSADSPDLWHQLKELWPSFAAYLVSFMVIGIIWVNHHGVIDHLRRADRPVLYLNLALLLTVGFLPYPTAVMAEHLNSGVDESVAAAFYSGAMALMGVAFGSLWVYITRHRWLLGVELSDEEVRSATRRFTLGNPIYLLAIGISVISPAAVLVIIAGLAVYYAVAGMTSPALRED
jgi:uncharacterized membrane protein